MCKYAALEWKKYSTLEFGNDKRVFSPVCLNDINEPYDDQYAALGRKFRNIGAKDLLNTQHFIKAQTKYCFLYWH